MPHRIYRFRLLACTLVAGAACSSAMLPGQDVVAPERLIFAAPAGDASEFTSVIASQARARRPEATIDDFGRLGWAWIGRARAAQDDGAYRLALTTADVIDRRFGIAPDTLLLRGHALHNLHRFDEAEQVARQLLAARGEARDYALLGDVLMERGDLSGAIAATQEFVNRRPGLESFARIAHLRWLRGDTAGAVSAMRSAVHAGDPREAEPLAWTLTRLAQLRLSAGDRARALQAAEAALAHQPGYAPALLARGRALYALGQPEAARQVLLAAADSTSLPEHAWWLADVLRATGDEAKALAVENKIIALGALTDPRTTALFLATRGIQPAEAVRLATAELTQRQDVHTHDALAWALFRAGQAADALPESRAALREGTRDARLLLHAGLIAQANGDDPGAGDLLGQARELAASLTPSERQLLSPLPPPAAMTVPSS